MKPFTIRNGSGTVLGTAYEYSEAAALDQARMVWPTETTLTAAEGVPPPTSLTTTGFEPNVRWQPFIDGVRVGYKVTRLADGLETFIYMNPSDSGTGEPDVFVYSGTFDDPANDTSLHFYTPDFGEVAAPDTKREWKQMTLAEAKADVERIIFERSKAEGETYDKVEVNLFYDGDFDKAGPAVGVRVAGIGWGKSLPGGGYCGSDIMDSPGEHDMLTIVALTERAILYRMVHLESDDENQLAEQNYIDAELLDALYPAKEEGAQA